VDAQIVNVGFSSKRQRQPQTGLFTVSTATCQTATTTMTVKVEHFD